MKYPVAKPDTSGNEMKYLKDCIDTGWISSQGSYVQKFEELFAKKHKSKYGVACSSGTNAIVLALRALGIGKGDEVIVPDFTMIATAWAVTMTGATPVFVDCAPDLNIDARRAEGDGLSPIERVITPETKAIIPVHVYGRQCDMKSIMNIAYEYNLWVIEDSCEAHGVVPMGDIACYSLFANKIITAGEGGICLTNSKRAAEQMKHLRGMAFNPEHTFFHKKMGYNFRMTNLQAAVALAQTERLEEFLEKRKQIEKWYDKYLPEEITKGIKDLEAGKRDVLWMYDVAVTKQDRDPLMKHLADNGIETRVFFKPMEMQTMYFDSRVYGRIAYQLSFLGFYLPTYTQLEEEDIKFIASKVKEYYAKKRI